MRLELLDITGIAYSSENSCMLLDSIGYYILSAKMKLVAKECAGVDPIVKQLEGPSREKSQDNECSARRAGGKSSGQVLGKPTGRTLTYITLPFECAPDKKRFSGPLLHLPSNQSSAFPRKDYRSRVYNQLIPQTAKA
ncbi:hypothetical protein HAX54_044084 [Datura stramonium]|uniref:Uncharacterized protein n=1 Tax=Datura stramonium TaxID=4076 RepID=A0ABS8W5I5_DATST|nr:hypothetical protein [Datura stramonium]